VVSSALLETELRRVAVREDIEQAAVTDLISRVDLVEPSRSMFHEAGILPGRTLRALDALHLVTALRMEASFLLAYDGRLLDAADKMGLRTVSPA